MNDPAGVSAVGAWGLNVVSSVGIIMVNKMVLSVFKFRFGEQTCACCWAATAQRQGCLCDGASIWCTRNELCVYSSLCVARGLVSF